MKRLDLIISDHLQISREKAQTLIKDGYVKADGKTVTKPSAKYEDTLLLDIAQPPTQYVSRGGYKLEAALAHFAINVANTTCIDIGASTGGFTDCLLQHGASQVYAVDVGTNQLHPSLHNHPQIISLENTNIRTATGLPQGDIVVIDVSFISLTLVLPVVTTLLKQGGYCLALVKPQFEAGPQHLNKQGVVKNKNIHKKVLQNIKQTATDLGLGIVGHIESPIQGKQGNTEYFLTLNKE